MKLSLLSKWIFKTRLSYLKQSGDGVPWLLYASYWSARYDVKPFT